MSDEIKQPDTSAGLAPVKKEEDFIPKSRFNEVIGERNDLRKESEVLKHKADLLDQLTSNPEFQAFVNSRQNKAETDDVSSFDPDTKKYVEQMINQKVNPVVQQFQAQMGPLLTRLEMQNLKENYGLSEKQLRDAEPFIRQKQAENPYLTSEEAFKIMYAFDDRLMPKGTGAPKQPERTVETSVTSTELPTMNLQQLKEMAQKAVKEIGPNHPDAIQAQLRYFKAIAGTNK